MRIKYVPEYSPTLRGKVDAYYKQVSMELYISDEGVCIDGMNSDNPGHGECQEMMDLLREDFKDKELCGSPPVSDASKHIFDKKGIEYRKFLIFEEIGRAHV